METMQTWYKSAIPAIVILIIEMDGGLGHGNKQWGKNKNISPKESLKTDRLKDAWAIDNGYSIIRIDCKYGRNNRFETVRDNVCESPLATIYDLSRVDFKKIDSLCWKSDIKIACEMYDNSQLSVSEIAEKMKLYHETVRDYLKKGADLGICSYSVKDNRRPQSYYDGRKGTRVLQYDEKDKSFIACYNSIHEASESTNVDVSYITATCKGMRDSGKGYIWRYCKDCLDGQYVPAIPERYLLPINQYDKDGHYIRTYSTLVEIWELYPDYTKSINRVVRVDHSIYYQGFLWKLDEGNHEDIESYVTNKGRAIIQIDPDTKEIIGRFRSIREASAETGANNIGAVLAGKRKRAGNSCWKYEDEFINRQES